MKIPVYEIEKSIALGLSCNNNSEEEITRALDPWVDHVDLFIVVEGRYRVPYSPTMMKGKIPPKYGPNTYSILKKHYPDKFWYTEYYGLQHDKRQRYFNHAGDIDCEVLIVCDTDDIIHPDYTDFNKLLRQIALLSEFAEDKPAIVNQWAWIPDEQTWSRQHNIVESNTWREYHRIHLNPGKQKYVLNHFTFAPLESTEKQIIEFSSNKEKNATEKNPYLLYPMGVCDGVRITTNRKLRTNEQNDYGNNWSFQWMHEENYRAYLLELQALGMDVVYEQQYRKPFTYYFDHNGKPIMYTKEEQERFTELEL